MKTYPRLTVYKTEIDSLSEFLSTLSFDIVYFTNWPAQDHKTLKNIITPHCKLILLEKGRCCVYANSNAYQLDSNDLLFVPPYSAYDAETFEGVNSYEIFFDIAPLALEQEFLEKASLRSITQSHKAVEQMHFVLLHDSFQRMQEHADGGYAQLQSLLRILVIRLLLAQGLSSVQSDKSHGMEKDILVKFFSYLENHITEPTHVQQICETLGISQSYLWRCCSDTMNVSPSQAIMRYKLRYAQALLKKSELSITQVAEAIGMDPYYFSSQFKKFFFVSPSDYRKSMR